MLELNQNGIVVRLNYSTIHSSKIQLLSLVSKKSYEQESFKNTAGTSTFLSYLVSVGVEYISQVNEVNPG